MRARLVRPLALLAAACLAIAGWSLGACSSFGAEPPATPDGASPVGDASLEGAVGPDGSLVDGTPGDDGGPSTRCGACEGPCLPVGKTCAPHVPFTGVPAGDITGLAMRGDVLYIASQGPQSGIWKVDVPAEGATAAFGSVASIAAPVGLAASDTSLFTTTPGAAVGRVVAQVRNGSPGAELSTLAATLVAASSSHLIAGGATAIHACPLSDVFGGCMTDTNSVVVTHVAIAGNYGCIVGSLSGSETRVFCRDGLALPVARAPAGNATALAVGPDRVAWAEGDFIRTETLSGASSPAEFQLNPLSGVISALAIDGPALFYVRGNDLFQCPLADCGLTKRVKLTTSATPMAHLTVRGKFVYFALGSASLRTVARVPRSP